MRTPGFRFASLRELGIHSNFFEVMGLPVVRGRALTSADREGAPLAAVLSEKAARALFPDADPIGQQTIMFGITGRRLEIDIVGVVKDVGLSTLGEDTVGTLFLSNSQERALGRTAEVSFEVRTVGDPSHIVSAIQQAAREIDPGLPLFGFTTQVQLFDERVAPVYRVALTWALLAGVALVLTGIGLYGLISYGAARRTNEIGIRMALGARRFHVISLVMKQTLVLVVIAAVAGAVVSLVVSQTIRAFVFGVTLYDPMTMATVLLIILAVTGLAGYLPARRAAHVDPSSSLRSE
jgi:hypothetical protein